MGEFGKDGFTDNKIILDPEYDVVTTNWGGAWRMPTKEEQDELIEKCTWTWSLLNVVEGCKGVGQMEILFFFAAGCMGKGMLIEADLYGDYWSSSLHISNPTCAYVMFLGDLVGRGA